MNIFNYWRPRHDRIIARIWFAAVGVMAAAEITAHAGASYRSGSSLCSSARDA